MSEIIGGLLMVVGGGMLGGCSVSLARSQPRYSAELVAALPVTPCPQPDPELDALVAQLN